MPLTTVDFTIIALYLIAVPSLAQWVAREKAAHRKDTTDYFLASKALPWWAVGTSLIAANISAEQIIGMSGSGYAIGLAIATYEWVGALTLLVVGKWLLPIFLANNIYTMPQFLALRYGPTLRTLMAVFWLALYIFVNLTSIIWLGSIALHQVAGFNQDLSLYLLAGFALLYQLYGGLKAVALTDVVQVSLLVLGGLIVTAIALSRVGHGDILGGFSALTHNVPDHFVMILPKTSPYYKDLPGFWTIFGGLWVTSLSYFGFNQYIIQRGLAAKSLDEARQGIVLAAYLKVIMPLIVVLPGIAAVVLVPHLSSPDNAYPAMVRLLPPGLLGLVFAALIAAVIASTASKINSIATIFTLDIFAKLKSRAVSADVDPARETKLVNVGRLSAVAATLMAALTARPLLGSADQAFQFIQEFTGFFTPGIAVIFLLGLFWRRANEVSAIVAAILSVALSALFKLLWPDVPFLNRVGLVFLLSLAAAIVVALASKDNLKAFPIERAVRYRTTLGFNLSAFGIAIILVGFYLIWT